MKNPRLKQIPCTHPGPRFGRGACPSCYSKWYRSVRLGKARKQGRERMRKARKEGKSWASRGGAWKDRDLRQRYGMTLEQYIERYNAQNGVCKLCGLPPKGRSLLVDHDHGTGQVRGLLCVRCNQAISVLDDFGGWAERAMQYREFKKEEGDDQG